VCSYRPSGNQYRINIGSIPPDLTRRDSIYLNCFVCFWRNSPVGPSFARFLDNTQRRTTIGRTPLDEWSARRRDLYLTTHDTHNRQTSIPPMAFEPTISAGERPQTYALDRAATGIGIYLVHGVYLCVVYYSHNYHRFFPLNKINRLFFVRETSVSSEVRTGILSTVYVNSYSEGRAGVMFRTWWGQRIEATVSSGLSSCSVRSDISTFGQYSSSLSVFKSPTCYPKRESSPVNQKAALDHSCTC
jgi:hypothetical protein